MRKTSVPAAILMVAILFAFMAACGSESTQNEKEENKGGSEAQKNEQANGQAAAGEGGEMTDIGRPPEPVFGSSYVAPLTEIFGDVFIGQKNFVAANTVLRAAPGERVELGSESNVQDNVVVRARTDTVTIGERTSLTHHAIVENSDIGNFVFVGYDAQILDSGVGDGAYIYHGARVEGVDVPEDSFVGPGEVVSDQAAADALPKVDEVDISKYYNRKQQLDTNREFAQAYIDLFEEDGFDVLLEVGPNPKTSWNQEQVEPQLGENVELQPFARATGDVRLGENSSVGRRTAIRADEGDPISIGSGAAIDDRVSFHSTRGAAIKIGKFLVASDDSVIHGPLEMGDRNFVGENAVVFRVRMGDDVQIGEGAVVAGPTGKDRLEIPDGTQIPAGTVVTTEKDVQALEQR